MGNKTGRLPDTHYAVLLECKRYEYRGWNFAPTGADYKRARALVRRGLLEPTHGRKGEGVEHFRLSAYGRSVMGIDSPGATLERAKDQASGGER